MLLGYLQIYNTFRKKSFYVIFMIFTLTNSYSQETVINSKPDFLYLIKQIRVFPDTSLLKIEYFDKNDNIVYYEEYNDKEIYKIEKSIYKNDTIKEFYRKHNSGGLSKMLFNYFNDTVVIFGYSYGYIEYIRILTYRDKVSKNKNINTDELYDIYAEDTVIDFFKEYKNVIKSDISKKYWKYVSKYDRFGRKIKWSKIRENKKNLSTFYKYKRKTDSLPSKTWTNHNTLITRQFFDSKINTIEIEYNSSIIQRKIEHYDNDSFKYKEEIYGLFYSYHHFTGDEDIYIKEKIKNKPDQIIIYEKSIANNK